MVQTIPELIASQACYTKSLVRSLSNVITYVYIPDDTYFCWQSQRDANLYLALSVCLLQEFVTGFCYRESPNLYLSVDYCTHVR